MLVGIFFIIIYNKTEPTVLSISVTGGKLRNSCVFRTITRFILISINIKIIKDIENTRLHLRYQSLDSKHKAVKWLNMVIKVLKHVVNSTETYMLSFMNWIWTERTKFQCDNLTLYEVAENSNLSLNNFEILMLHLRRQTPVYWTSN